MEKFEQNLNIIEKLGQNRKIRTKSKKFEVGAIIKLYLSDKIYKSRRTKHANGIGLGYSHILCDATETMKSESIFCNFGRMKYGMF